MLSSMPNKHLILLISLLILLPLLGCRTATSNVYVSPTIPVDGIEPGDIAFRLGRTLHSSLIASAGDSLSSFSHVGIIVERDGELAVIHIEPSSTNDSIRRESIGEFFQGDRSAAGAIFRVENLDDVKLSTILGHAERIYNSRILFDHDYMLSDATRMYCTELIEHIYSHCGISLSRGMTRSLPLVKEPVILPADMAQNPMLKCVWSYRDLGSLPAR